MVLIPARGLLMLAFLDAIQAWPSHLLSVRSVASHMHVATVCVGVGALKAACLPNLCPFGAAQGMFFLYAWPVCRCTSRLPTVSRCAQHSSSWGATLMGARSRRQRQEVRDGRGAALQRLLQGHIKTRWRKAEQEGAQQPDRAQWGCDDRSPRKRQRSAYHLPPSELVQGGV